MNIGVLQNNYASQRLFLNLLEECTYTNLRNKNKYLYLNVHKVISRLLGANVDLFDIIYNFDLLPGFKKPDLLHIFNTVCYTSNVPVVMHIEGAMPWVKCIEKMVEQDEPDFTQVIKRPEVQKRLEVLARPEYKQFLGLSRRAEYITREVWNADSNYSHLGDKLTTINLPQKILFDSFEKKKYFQTGKVRFIFVGYDFYRKGGYEMLKALTDLHKKYDFELVLVSSLRIDDHRYVNEEIIRHTKEMIANGSEWIKYTEKLPNNEVQNLLRASDVAFLPTFMDTYAYSTLECEAAGTPVISTDIRALSDINSNERGWLIEVPKNRLNHPAISSAVHVEKYRKRLYEGLYNTIKGILQDPEVIRTKGEKAYNYIKDVHNPEDYKQALQIIYQKAIVL